MYQSVFNMLNEPQTFIPTNARGLPLSLECLYIFSCLNVPDHTSDGAEGKYTFVGEQACFLNDKDHYIFRKLHLEFNCTRFKE